ncbi:hypothetical protein MBLNU230_g1331t1 [Neophaeotheca triangularis]
MRRQRILRASSSQSLCLFCACRFAAQETPAFSNAPFQAQRRHISRTRPPFQTAAAASAPAQPSNDNQNGAPEPAWSFDPNSSLSASEQPQSTQQRMALPSFGSVQQESEAKNAGWGTGFFEIKPLEYRAQEDVSRPQDEVENAISDMAETPKPVLQQSRYGTFGRPPPKETPEDVFAGIDFDALDEKEKQRKTEGQHDGAQKAPFKESLGAELAPGPSNGPAPFQPAEEETSPYTPQYQRPFEGAFPVSQPPSYSQTEQRGVPSRSQASFGNDQPANGQSAHVLRQQDQQHAFDNSHQGSAHQRNNSQSHFSPSKFETPSYSDVGYRAMLFNPEQYPRRRKTEDDSQAESWQHLKRRNSEPSPPTQQQREQQQQPNYYDDEWVDRRFQEHQQQRQQVFPPRSQEPREMNNSPMPNYASRSSPTSKCARCGQVGHTARNCEGPRFLPCFHCGEYGHFARDCTNPSTLVAREPFTPFQGNRDSVQPSGRKADPAMDPEGRAMFPERRRSKFTNDKEFDEKDEEDAPQERVLRSKKFVDEPAPKKKAARRSRRDEDEDVEDFEQARPARRKRRDTEDDVDEDYLEGMRGEGRARRDNKKAKERKAAKEAEKKAARAAKKSQQSKPVNLPDFVSVSQLAQALGARYEPFVERLAELGYDDVFPGKVLNSEISGMIAMEYDFEPVFESGDKEAEERDIVARPEIEDTTFLPTRPPVVTIMGHVDHGKTTILDYLRKSSVAAGEAGGITQHIGAFSVPLAASGKTITFLDTPGHAAFLAMRQRGAIVTDIVILVVAADDSVKPQTIEAIKHAKSAGVPMIVAVNKVDKAESDVQRVKQDLARHGVEIEDFGGDTQVVPVSGKTGQGMDELEEAAVTLSEILDHRAETDGSVEGWVLEATTKKAGRVATVLVRRGTLKPGSVIVAGKTWARVRSLRNEAGQAVKEVGPGMPAEVDGWRDQPTAGDEVLQAPNEQRANSAVEYRLELEERSKTATDMEAINEARRAEQEKREADKAAEEAAKRAAAGEESPTDTSNNAAAAEEPTGPTQVPFIIKADVSGSAEAVTAYISSISSAFVMPKILTSAVGAVHESDIEHAAIAGGYLVAFNLPSNPEMAALAESRGVQILENNIIYRVLDDVKAVLETKIPDLVTQRVLGEAEIGQNFEIGVGGRKKVLIAGCKVRNGSVGKGARARVFRQGEKVYDGTISSLKHVKKDVTEMRKGTECGIGFDGWEGFEVGDSIQTYEEVREKRKL